MRPASSTNRNQNHNTAGTTAALRAPFSWGVCQQTDTPAVNAMTLDQPAAFGSSEITCNFGRP